MNRAPSILLATPRQPGAIAIIQAHGEPAAIDELLRRATSAADWPVGRMRLVALAGIDEGLAARLAPGVAQLMPHGGPRVVQRLMSWLAAETGAHLADAAHLDPQQVHPEAEDRFEAIALLAVARAASPLAIDVLLDQPRRWRDAARRGLALNDDDRARSARLQRLIDPPIVALAGAPNVGKSTLSNALLGRAMSIAADVAGTTRDYTAGRIDLGGLVVDWHDTPGLRESSDPIEQRAIAIARRLVARADLLIAMRDPQRDWPALPREPDLRVINKLDDEAREAADAGGESPLRISALRGRGLAALVMQVRERLVPAADLAHPGPWLFDPRLLRR